jgi:hypothetical protein
MKTLRRLATTLIATAGLLLLVSPLSASAATAIEYALMAA